MLLLLPMVTPEIVMGISLLLFFSQVFGENGSFAQISLAHVTFCVSYVAVIVRARAIGAGPAPRGGRPRPRARRRSGRSGTSRCRSSRRPSPPAAMLAFALSFDDLVVTSFNAGVGDARCRSTSTSSIRFGVTPEINAISTIIVAVAAVALFIAWRLGTFRGEDRPAPTTARLQPA